MEEHNTITRTQKIVLYVLYALLVLMVIFSFLALRNVGEQGYKQCVQEKCDTKGDAFCSKLRELDNFCAGAGGKLAGISNPKPGEPAYTCVFK